MPRYLGIMPKMKMQIEGSEMSEKNGQLKQLQNVVG